MAEFSFQIEEHLLVLSENDKCWTKELSGFTEITHEKQVTACLKAGGNCGSCLPEIRGLIKTCQLEAEA